MTRRKTGSGIRMKERLQKLLSAAGVCSRRAAEGYITAGRVTVNGETALLGQQADPETDDIRVDGVPLGREPEAVYLMLNKPRGYVTTVSDEQGRKTVMDLLTGVSTRVYPVGRLDRDSEGLLLLTNQGDLAHDLLSPKKHVDKEYFVRVDGCLTAADCAAAAAGLHLDDGLACLPAELAILPESGGREAHIIIREGKFHQIKRMMAYLGKPVLYLERIRMGNLPLDPAVSRGSWRFLTEEECRELEQMTRNAEKPRNFNKK